MIRIDGIKKSYGAKVILRETSYHFPPGERIALVGANGTGKTTLLNILCGIEEADGGTVLKPGKLTLGYLPQEPNPRPALSILEECTSGAGRLQELKRRLDNATAQLADNYSTSTHTAFENAEEEFRAAGGYALESRAKGILLGLGFQNSDFIRSPLDLSGGWRMRLELARIFVNDPDFLVLDEPTNHLDLPSLVWVERYLQQFAGTLLFVSHDRDLLNRLSTHILHLHFGVLTPYKGNFDAFLDERALRMEQEAAATEALKKQKEKLESFIARFGAKATKAAQAQSRVKMLARLTALETEDPGKESTLHFVLPEPPPSGREVYRVENGSIGYSKPLATAVNLKVQRGQKIAVIGANGIGKSTLLRTISGRLKALEGKFEAGYNVSVGYFAQDQLEVLKENDSILKSLTTQAVDMTEGQARSLLGQFLFRGDDVFKPVGVLSGGEKSRVGLACLLSRQANLLLLDEPTNHLDMSSAEVLATAIDSYEGTVLFVSHDRAFINETCTHVFAMLSDGRSALFEGQLDDYERLSSLAGFPNVLAVDASGKMTTLEHVESGPNSNKNETSTEKLDAGALKKERTKLEKTVAKLDTEMHALNDGIATLETHMAGPDATDYGKVRAWQKESDEKRSRLHELEEEWLEASHRLETVTGQLQSLGRA